MAQQNNTSKKIDKVRKRKRDTITMLLVIMVGLLVIFGGYYMMDSESNGDPQSNGPSPLEEDDSMSFEFSLMSSGKHSVDVHPGESFTVVYRIYRNDIDSDFVIYAVQNEIEYDSSVFELIEDSISCGYTYSIHDYDGGVSRIFMNAYAVTPAGFDYKQGAEFGSFTLRVKEDAPAGKYDITSNEYGMAAQGGYSLYSSTVRDLTVEIVEE